MNRHKFATYIFLLAVLFSSCKSGPFNLIKSTTPHQDYERKLVTAGLSKTAIGKLWIAHAQSSLEKSLPIKLPYQEQGYFSAEHIEAVAYRFDLKQGEKFTVKLSIKSSASFMIYADVLNLNDGNDFKLVASADTLGNQIQLDVEKSGTFVLRLQPELLGSGSYTLELTTGPSLGYPLKVVNKNQIQSLFGVGRDDGARKHEGIDIFSSFRTPVLAVSNGTVTRVNTNNLGGNVVWFRPEGKDYSLYYAHLDEQSVTDGQQVLQGDTLGRMGNTGNAKTTPPHLHFGIYTGNGAVDPLPFINPILQVTPKIFSSLAALNTTMRTTGKTTLVIDNDKQVILKAGTIVRVNGAQAKDYRIELPDGTIGFLASAKLVSASKILSKYKVKSLSQRVLDKPENDAALKKTLAVGEVVDVIGNFGDYQLIIDDKNQTGWILI